MSGFLSGESETQRDTRSQELPGGSNPSHHQEDLRLQAGPSPPSEDLLGLRERGDEISGQEDHESLARFGTDHDP